MAGTITGKGGNGINPASSTDCSLTGPGGGSGGHIHLIANKVNNTGTVTAAGGNGDFSWGNGGGGGGGGRITVDTVIKSGAGTYTAAGGTGGNGGGSCGDGSNGGAGFPNKGTELIRAAGVTRASTSPWVPGSATLHLKGVQKGGGAMDIVYCHQTLPLGTANPFDNAGLDPPSGSSTEDLDARAVTSRHPPPAATRTTRT